MPVKLLTYRAKAKKNTQQNKTQHYQATSKKVNGMKSLSAMVNEIGTILENYLT